MAERAFELLELETCEQEGNVHSSLSSGDEEMSALSESDACYDDEKSLIVQSFSSNPKLILDIGCGSGLSAEVICRAGHVCIGTDISQAMLKISHEDQDSDDDDGDSENIRALDIKECILHDMGDGMPFRPAVFDGVISISALQWLFHAHSKRHNPRRRLTTLLTTLNSCMVRGARAVFQFYPETEQQIDMCLEVARRAGFSGGLVIDHPESTKAKKYYLCLASGMRLKTLPRALGVGFGLSERDQQGQVSMADCGWDDEDNQGHDKKGWRSGSKKGNVAESRRSWVLRKKERDRQKNPNTFGRPDSKYTGRRRKPRF